MRQLRTVLPHSEQWQRQDLKLVPSDLVKGGAKVTLCSDTVCFLPTPAAGLAPKLQGHRKFYFLNVQISVTAADLLSLQQLLLRWQLALDFPTSV